MQLARCIDMLDMVPYDIMLNSMDTSCSYSPSRPSTKTQLLLPLTCYPEHALPIRHQERPLHPAFRHLSVRRTGASLPFGHGIAQDVI